MIITQEMQELITDLNNATELYDKGTPVYSDQEWDSKYFHLKELEEYSGIIFPNSPTQKIYFKTVSALDKRTHNHNMLSLDKTKDLNDILSFINEEECIIMPKMDGLTVSLLYENGELISGETRGDGFIGEDITHNIQVMSSVPKNIPIKDRLVVDGEVVCTYKDFEPFADKYKNPRNFASGSIRLLDAAESKKRNLTFVAWEVIEGTEGFKEISTLSEKLALITEYGFNTVPYFIINNNSNLEQEVQKMKEISSKLSYPIDGCVFKYNNVDFGKSLGATAHHAKNAMAFKFYDETVETTLIDIEWSMGRTGQISPVALFEKINIDGTEISRASLSNISIMHQTLGLHPFKGQIIEVSKRNQIIPKIERAKDEYGEWITNI